MKLARDFRFEVMSSLVISKWFKIIKNKEIVLSHLVFHTLPLHKHWILPLFLQPYQLKDPSLVKSGNMFFINLINQNVFLNICTWTHLNDDISGNSWLVTDNSGPLPSLCLFCYATHFIRACCTYLKVNYYAS